MDRITAASVVDMNTVGSESEVSRFTQSVGRGDREAHWIAKVLFPKPAGATTAKISAVCIAVLSSRRLRVTSA